MCGARAGCGGETQAERRAPARLRVRSTCVGYRASPHQEKVRRARTKPAELNTAPLPELKSGLSEDYTAGQGMALTSTWADAIYLP